MTTVLDCIERIPKSLKGIRDSYPERTKNIADYLSGRGIKKIIPSVSPKSVAGAFDL